MMAKSPSGDPLQLQRRRRSQRAGHAAELLAAAALMARGYRILGRRWSSPLGEIDLIAARGRRLAFLEVKQRPTLLDCEVAITDAQGRRIRDAAELWLARHAAFQDHDIHFDAVFVLPWRWPRHMEDRV